MSVKRRREPSSIDTQLVEIFEDLANESEEIRIKAASALLSKFSGENDSTQGQLVRVVKRLIRGLCSGRKAARVGFSVALTELLSQQWPQSHVNGGESYQIPDLIDNLVKQTETTGKISGQEERDHYFGRLFGAEAFIKSGILFKPDLNADVWSRLLDIIYGLAKTKPWLREECGWILYSACDILKDGDWNPSFIEALVERLCQVGLAKTPEGIAIWLKARIDFPGANLPGNVWRGENPLHKKELSRLAKILKGTPVGEDAKESNGEVTQKGSWSSKLHFVWMVLFTELANPSPATSSVGASKTVTFGQFWKEAVDDQLFAQTASEERKYWGLSLFQQLWSIAPAVCLEKLFTRNFIRCLINQLASNERYLNRAAEKTVKVIFKRIEMEPSAAYAALSGLASPNLNISFDQASQTKTVDRLFMLADDGSLRRFVPELCSKLLHPGVQDERAATVIRRMIADQLIVLLKSRQSRITTEDDSSPDVNFIIDAVSQAFVTCSYFLVGAVRSDRPDLPNPPVSTETQDMLRTRVTSWLSLAIGTFPHPARFAHRIVHTIHTGHSNAALQPTIDLNGRMGKQMAATWEVLKSVHRKVEAQTHSNKDGFLEAFELLYSLTILQVYNGDADAVSMLDELSSCYDTLIKHRQTSDQRGSEGLVEILLGLAAKPSKLFRRSVQQVFTTFTSDINHNGLRSMFEVLETEETVAGQNGMFEEEDGGSVASNAASDIGSDVEELETVDIDGADSSPESDEDNEESDFSTDEAGVEEGQEEELAAFNQKLAQALKTKPANAAVGAASDEDSSDEDMDDEQMEALDEHIANIFKGREKAASKKRQNKLAKETVVNFKRRVLELLEIYIKQQLYNPLALSLLLPLLTVIRTTRSTLVSGKACALVQDFNKKCKRKELPDTYNKPEVLQLLKDVHEEVMREGSNVHSSACSKASLLLVKVLVAHNSDNLREAKEVYSRTQTAMAKGKYQSGKKAFVDEWLMWLREYERMPR
ncbi:MAG: hypothetical protein Q9208_000312 [Pyrenodesmia sp. 3 TL-2023]